MGHSDGSVYFDYFCRNIFMMRIPVISFLVLVSQTCFGQRLPGSFEPSAITFPAPGTERNYIDTVMPISFIPQNEGGLGCFTGVYHAPDSGYVSGNNKYGDLDKAQFYILSKMGFGSPGTIQQVAVYFGLKTLSAFPGAIYVSVYDVDTSGFQPGNVLASSLPINLTDLNTGGLPSVFTLPLPVSVKDSFFVSVVLPQTNGDTVAIVSTLDECTAFSAWSWERWSNGTWHSLVNSWILDVDLAIFPVMDLPFNTGVNAIGLISNSRLFPNPSSSYTQLSYTLQGSGDVKIRIYDALGKVTEEINKGFQPAGSYSENLNFSGRVAGLYHVAVFSGGLLSMQSMVVE